MLAQVSRRDSCVLAESDTGRERCGIAPAKGIPGVVDVLSVRVVGRNTVVLAK